MWRRESFLDGFRKQARAVASNPNPQPAGPANDAEKPFDKLTSDVAEPGDSKPEQASADTAAICAELATPLVVGTPGPSFEARPIGTQFRSTPYRPDSVMDGWGENRFTVRAASVRGQLHRFNGAPRQDDFALAWLRSPDRLIIAVADGVSSAAQSHLGATIAVRFALQWLIDHLVDEPAKVDWHELFRHAAWQLVAQSKELFARDDEDPRFAESQLATTLICAVIDFRAEDKAAKAYIVGVGDSGAWVTGDGTFARLFGGKNGDSPITSSAVSGLPQVPKELAAIVTTLTPGSVLLIGTDGFGDPLGSGDAEVGKTFADVLRTPPSLLSFAHLLDFSRETFDDDRTLVAVWLTPDAPVASGG